MLLWATQWVPTPIRRSNKNPQENEEYQRRKDEWANRYTNLDSLRETFGANRNKVWGDLDAATARRVYKTLLPKALLELVKLGLEPEDLAPLAYQARVAAKMYARERCQVPSRVLANLFDGYRQWKTYGKFQTAGMSYDQVWEKYQNMIREELRTDVAEDLTEQDVTAKICLKILERSCETNERIDRWVLPPDSDENQHDLTSITEKLETDVRKLLHPVTSMETPYNLTLQKYRTWRVIAKARRRAKNYHKRYLQQVNGTLPSEALPLACFDEQDLASEPWNNRQSKTRNRPKPWLNREGQQLPPPPRRD
jgi:hypothetical protein